MAPGAAGAHGLPVAGHAMEALEPEPGPVREEPTALEAMWIPSDATLSHVSVRVCQCVSYEWIKYC